MLPVEVQVGKMGFWGGLQAKGSGEIEGPKEGAPGQRPGGTVLQPSQACTQGPANGSRDPERQKTKKGKGGEGGKEYEDGSGAAPRGGGPKTGVGFHLNHQDARGLWPRRIQMKTHGRKKQRSCCA